MVKTALILAPHPDDETLGCAGIIQKLKKNNYRVCVCCVSSIDFRSTQGMFEKACDILKVDEVITLAYEQMYFYKELGNIIKDVDKMVKKYKPAYFFMPHKGDSHQDHRSLFEAAIVATRSICTPIEKILCYQVLSSTDQSPLSDDWLFKPNYFVELTESEVLTKIKALEAYDSELRFFPHPRSREGIEIAAKWWGMHCNVPYAEPFVLLKGIMQN